MTANIVPLAFGTETDSSIIGPAYRAGIVGIKPTVGLTSRSGVIPISENMDSVGPFGRTVYDAVLGLNAIVLSDEHDPATQVPERVRELDYTKFISDKSALNGARFGLPWKRCWDSVPRDQLAAAQRVLDAIEVIGGALVRTDFPSAEERIPEHGKWDWYVFLSQKTFFHDPNFQWLIPHCLQVSIKFSHPYPLCPKAQPVAMMDSILPACCIHSL